MSMWAGFLIMLYGTLHTVGAFVFLGAAQHVGSWLNGRLLVEDLADIPSWSPALSAYWASVNSFGPPLIILGAIVVWLAGRGTTPPAFIAWALLGWTVVDAVLSGFGGQALIIVAAVALMLLSAHRTRSRRYEATR